MFFFFFDEVHRISQIRITIITNEKILKVLKSGDPSNVRNYRHISLIPHLAKLYESIINPVFKED